MPDEPVPVEGNLATVDLEKRFFTLENREGVIFIRVDWDPLPYFDHKMRKQKIGYYEKPVVVMTGENTARLKELEYTDRPASFPKRQQQKGAGRQYQSRDEMIVVFQTCYKAQAEALHIIMPELNIIDVSEMSEEDKESFKGKYNFVMDIARDRAIVDAGALIEARRKMA